MRSAGRFATRSIAGRVVDCAARLKSRASWLICSMSSVGFAASGKNDGVEDCQERSLRGWPEISEQEIAEVEHALDVLARVPYESGQEIGEMIERRRGF